MIDLTLKFLTDEINLYLAQNSLVLNEMNLVMGNASRIFDTDPGTSDTQLANKAIISLVNVEEDRISRQREPYTKTITGIVYAQPPVLLNLYVLFVMNQKKYDVALKWLSAIIRFFQHQPVFTPLSHPALDAGIMQLTVDLHTLNFEQNNQLWSTLGGKYLPSVLYKVRQVSVDEAAITGGAGFMSDIIINEHGKQPVS